MSLARKQISLIHLAKARLGLEDEDYRAIIRLHGGADSARDLDQPGFNRVMDQFGRLGFRSDFQRRNFGPRDGMATVAQVDFMRRLWADYTGGSGTDQSLGRWIEKQWKVSSLRFVNARLAPKVITTLQRMTASKAAKAGQDKELPHG